MLRELTGCEAAAVVNNCAAAVLITLNTLAEGGEVLVSRGELIEIGGSFRIPDVIAKSGARIREVGTTNRTRLSDCEKAINENTRVILRAHPSNYRIAASPRNRRSKTSPTSRANANCQCLKTWGAVPCRSESDRRSRRADGRAFDQRPTRCRMFGGEFQRRQTAGRPAGRGLFLAKPRRSNASSPIR